MRFLLASSTGHTRERWVPTHAGALERDICFADASSQYSLTMRICDLFLCSKVECYVFWSLFANQNLVVVVFPLWYFDVIVPLLQC